ncbi:MAG: hypothetical protein ACLR8J_03520 [Sutterella wadsworthensis]
MTTAAPSIEPHLRQDLRKALERSFHAFETTDHHRHGGPDGRIPAASLAARAAASCPRLQAERRAPLQQDFTHACGRRWDGHHWSWGGHPLHARPGRLLEARES